jgi:hypothetical protein
MFSSVYTNTLPIAFSHFVAIRLVSINVQVIEHLSMCVWFELFIRRNAV